MSGQALGLARSDVDADQWLDEYYVNLVEDVVEKEGDLGPATTYERVVIALSAMGKDVTDVGGYDLLAGLADMSRMRAINSAVYGLIALDTLDHQVPEVSGVADPTTRQKLVDRVLQLEIAGGGWAFFGSTPDPDMTGMALQALSRYVDQPAVAAAVERGVTKLSDIQRPSGAFASYGVESVESTTQVMLALTALGIDPATDPRFAQEGGNPVTAHARFYVDGGGFWYPAPGAPNGMATAAGLLRADGLPPLPRRQAQPLRHERPGPGRHPARAHSDADPDHSGRARPDPRSLCRAAHRARRTGRHEGTEAAGEGEAPQGRAQGQGQWRLRGAGPGALRRPQERQEGRGAQRAGRRSGCRDRLGHPEGPAQDSSGSKKVLGQYKVVVRSVGSADPKRSTSTGTFRLRAA